MRLLIIEDSKEIVENLYDYFDENIYELDCARDGLGGLHLACTQTYDVIILDLSLPVIDGITLCRRLREEGNNTTPIIMLTARQTIEDRVLGLSSGADDYLVKPFSLKELEARIQALSRRSNIYSEKKILVVDDLQFNLDTMEVTRAGIKIVLTPILLKLLEKLMRSSPNVVTKSELEYYLWKDSPPNSDSLRAHLHTLRTAIDKPFSTPLLMTLHGIGYRLMNH
ncbi:response regulator transcription factor [Aurantivibrio infirmus]